MTTANSHLATLTVQIVNPLIAATTETFKTMMDCTAKRRDLGLKDKRCPYHPLTAVIGLTGRASGSFCLSLPRRTAYACVHRMLDIQVAEVDELVCDTIGEFGNVIAGSAKDSLSHLDLELGLPNVIVGDGYEVDFPSRSQPMFVNFTSDIGPFMIVFGFVSH